MGDFRNSSGKESKVKGKVGGDRRANRRYEISLELRWKVVWRRQIVDTGSGRTLDLSSGGVMFESTRPLPSVGKIELSITWPARLQNVTQLQLIVCGRMVRSDGFRTAMRVAQHQFKTLGMDHRLAAGDEVRSPALLEKTESAADSEKTR